MYFKPTYYTNASGVLASHYSGNLYLGIRDGDVDPYGEPLNPEYYDRNEGSFSVDIIVWEKEDWFQIVAFFERMKEKDPDNKAIIDAFDQAYSRKERYLASKEASREIHETKTKIQELKEEPKQEKRPVGEERYVTVKKPVPSVPKIAPATKRTKIKERVTDPEIDKRYAVVVGIGKYRDDRIPRLKYTTVDAESIYEILTDPQYGNFPKSQVKLLLDEQATYNNIKSAIGTWLKRNARKGDTVIIFFAGHGAPEDEKTYWVTYNANIDDLYGTALSNDEIADMLDRTEAKKVIAFLDSCYSAATINRTGEKRSLIIVKDPFQKFRGKGRVIITSSNGKEQSLEIEEFGHGVFTYYLLKALKGQADQNNDGYVELDEVWDYVKYRVTDTARKHGSTQTPIIDGSYSAGIVLSKHPERLRELEQEAEREKKEKELDFKIAKLTDLYSRGEITSSQFDKAVKILESGEKNKLLNDFLSERISLTTFKRVFK
jgi:uncharacterized caspase-like protein